MKLNVSVLAAVASIVVIMGLGTGITPAAAATGLANPAAEFCIENGGRYGIRDGADGAVGVCELPDGKEVDAWDHFRASLAERENQAATQLVNPAARFCAALGGTYTLGTGVCVLPGGSEVNAWDLLREAFGRTVSLANPAATHCIEMGGAYVIRDGDGGQQGICRFPNGSEYDAWALFRSRN